MRCLSRQGVLLLWLMLATSQAIAVPIGEIRFEGNKVTREKVLRQELLIQEGDEVNAKQIERSRQAIMNLGLFKTVTTRLEENGAAQHLVFTVEERYFLLPIPLIGAKAKDDNIVDGVGSYNYGIELRYDNLLGLNQRLRLAYETEEGQDIETPTKRETRLSYLIPRIIDTPFQLLLSAEHEEKDANELEEDVVVGSYHRQSQSAEFYLSRWVKPKWISQGWTVGAGMMKRLIRYSEQSGTALEYENNQLITINTGLDYDAVQHYPYHRKGRTYGYRLSLASPKFGSDSAFTHHHLYHRYYQPLDISDSNLNTQVKVSLASGSGTAFSLGNSSLLRGYENHYVEGNAMLLLNTEYHHHISGYRQLRGVLFADAGNAWEASDKIHLGHLPLGVGVGLRWRVQSFVDVTLRLDYAHALEADSNKLTLTTSASF